MRKKKALALLLSAAMTLGLLTGCSGGAKDSGNTALPSDTSSTDGEQSAGDGEYYTDEDGNKYKKFDDVKLKMLICWNGGYLTASDQYNNDVAKAIRDRIGVTVEFEGIMVNEAEKLNMMFASGDMPDMVNAPFWGGTAGETGIIKKAGAEGRLIDIKDLVPNYPNIADAYDIGVIGQKYLENDIDDPKFNGARYILPTELAGDDADIALWAYGVFVRGDVPEALGIDPKSIKTSEQLYDFMVKAKDYGFKDVNGNDCITATTYHSGWNYADYVQNFGEKKLTGGTGGYTKDANGKLTFDRLTENYIEKNLFLWKLVREGILDKECFTTSDDRAIEKVGNGTALFTCAQYGVTIDATKKSGLYNSNPEMRYTWVGPLNFSDGSELKQLEPNGRNGSPAIFFPTSCSNVDAALTWVDYLNSKEGMRLICYGFEGDTYELNADGQPRMNAELTARYLPESENVKKDLRDRGIFYMQQRTYVARKNMAWFGESEPFQSEAENEYLKEYKSIRTAEKIPGYPVDALAPNFEGYQEFAEWALDNQKEKEYIERAFFADTEEEARKILEDYQNYLMTNEGGKMQQFLDFMNEEAGKRDDVVY